MCVPVPEFSGLLYLRGFTFVVCMCAQLVLLPFIASFLSTIRHFPFHYYVFIDTSSPSHSPTIHFRGKKLILYAHVQSIRMYSRSFSFSQLTVTGYLSFHLPTSSTDHLPYNPTAPPTFTQVINLFIATHPMALLHMACVHTR
jgi:hypothetical protein